MLKFSEIKEIGQPFEVIRVGKWIHGGEPFEVTAMTLQNIINNFKNIRPKSPTKMVIDYNHGSAMSDNPEAGKAAGWISDLFIKENSLYAVPEWTEMAQKYIVNKEYGYASAELDLDYQNKETGKSVGTTLLAIALTNRPFIEGQEAVKLAEEPAEGDTAKNKGDKKMDDDVKKVVELTETVKSQTKVIDEQKVKLSEQEGEIKKLTDESNKTKETLKLAEANEWINIQFNEHKIFPKEKDVLVKMYLMDSVLAKEFVEKRGVVVPLGVKGEDVDDAKTTAEKQSAEIAKIKKFAEDNKITFPEARVKLLKGGK